tara:strand:- start:3188 stop:3931 length:744 start_codon:yes stop_codon:yes gene_type:complete
MIWRTRNNLSRFHKGILPLIGPMAASLAGGGAAAGASSAWWLPAAISAGGGILGGLLGGGDDDSGLDYEQLPDYPEATGARQAWWQRLQEFGQQPGYGGIAPDWGDIWDRAKGKIQQYFWGSPTSPGIIDKVKSSTSARNVADSPARESLIGRMGAEEAGLIKDTAQEQAVQEAQFGERARLNWLQNINQLSRRKPSFVTSTGGAGGGSGPGELVSTIGSSIGSALQSRQNRDWYERMLSNRNLGFS